MTREQDDNRQWDNFYARTMHLPPPELTSEFLAHVPQGGHILDFGTGSGTWTAGFLRDRPDLIIDVLDKNIDKAAVLPTDFSGQKYAISFENYRAPNKPYNAIWARAVLFFLDQSALDKCFHQLANSLAPHGTIAFTMVENCKEAALAKFHGMSEAAISKMLDKEGLEPVKITRHELPYGSQRIRIPTFDVYARKR